MSVRLLPQTHLKLAYGPLLGSGSAYTVKPGAWDSSVSSKESSIVDFIIGATVAQMSLHGVPGYTPSSPRL